MATGQAHKHKRRLIGGLVDKAVRTVKPVVGAVSRPLDQAYGAIGKVGGYLDEQAGRLINPTHKHELHIGPRYWSFPTFDQAYRAGVDAARGLTHAAFKVVDEVTGDVFEFGRDGKRNPAPSGASAAFKAGYRYYQSRIRTAKGSFTVANAALAYSKKFGEKDMSAAYQNEATKARIQAAKEAYEEFLNGTEAAHNDRIKAQHPEDEENPAVSAAQYGMAQAVLSGASTGMTKGVARRLVDETPARDRRRFAKELKRNPAPESAAMYETFHGVPSESVLTIHEDEHYHGNLAELGVLVGMKVETVSGYEVELGFGEGEGDTAKNPYDEHGRWQLTPEQREASIDSFAQQFAKARGMFGTTIQSARARIKKWSAEVSRGDSTHAKDLDYYTRAVDRYERLYKKKRNPSDPTNENTVLLCSSEDGKSLYLEGGDQGLDLAALKMDDDKLTRDSMVIGDIMEITYRTRKAFDKLKTIDYYHQLSEESKGPLPILRYDRINEKLYIDGGTYSVESAGIRD